MGVVNETKISDILIEYWMQSYSECDKGCIGTSIAGYGYMIVLVYTGRDHDCVMPKGYSLVIGQESEGMVLPPMAEYNTTGLNEQEANHLIEIVQVAAANYKSGLQNQR